MNVVQFEFCAFILPDDMDKWRQRYGADVVYLDAEEGAVWVLGPNDTEWREVPADPKGEGHVVSIRGKS